MVQAKTIANSILIFCLLLWSSSALAVPAATVTHLAGTLFAHTASGATKSLSIGSHIEAGDTVEAAKRTYARLKFTDGGEVTLKPGTRFLVEKYSYELRKPDDDAATFKLVKGGLRVFTGQIGKWGNRENYKMKSPTATIGIRGTVYDIQFCQENSNDDSCGTMPPGFYLAVTSGVVVITNSEGVQTTLEVKAGQYVYVKDSTSPPVVLPTRPDIPFNPPPSVGSGSSDGEGC